MKANNEYTKAINWKLFYRNVFALVIPIAIQNLINVGVTATDVIMLGKVGEKVLSGASLAGQIQYIMTLIFYGVTSGATVLTAQYWGKKDTRTIEKVLGMGLSAGLSLSFWCLSSPRHQNDRESPGYGIKCRTHRCGSIRRSSPWHAGDTDADLYL